MDKKGIHMWQGRDHRNTHVIRGEYRNMHVLCKQEGNTHGLWIRQEHTCGMWTRQENTCGKWTRQEHTCGMWTTQEHTCLSGQDRNTHTRTHMVSGQHASYVGNIGTHMWNAERKKSIRYVDKTGIHMWQGREHRNTHVMRGEDRSMHVVCK